MAPGIELEVARTAIVENSKVIFIGDLEETLADVYSTDS